jgi:hypothetical protein
MTDPIDPRRVDSKRLNQVDLELGRLAKAHHACRMNSFAFSAVGAVTLAFSVLGLIHLLPAGESDWTRNPDSPVYAVAAQQKPASMLEAGLVVGGFILGLGFVYRARTQCSRQHRLWQQEADLRTEMRRLLDKRDGAEHSDLDHDRFSPQHVRSARPLDSDATRET